VDAETGDFYGHVVAGVPDGYVAYIVPAVQTLLDIERVTKHEASLA